MSILSSLKLVAATTQPKANGIQRQRNKLAAKLDEQIEMASAKQLGANYAPRIVKSVTNPATEQRVQVEAYKRVRPWFWVSAAGGYCLNIRYGSKVIELAKGKNAIEAADLKTLIEALGTVKSAVLAGELDAEIEKASGALRSGFGKK
ncbi:MAG: hypothetical protein RLZ25_1221 [Pseudomonadota bacterium]|jgi:hypothetical protein